MSVSEPNTTQSTGISSQNYQKSVSLPQQIATLILKRITSKELQPGDQLDTEAQLVDTYGVSRNVIREAVASLRSRGILETRRGLGTFVREDALLQSFKVDFKDLLDMEYLTDIYALRIEVESGAAALAAIKRNKKQLEQLENALLKVNQSAPNWEQGAETAVDFHLLIARLTNNPYFEQLMTHLHSAIREGVRTLRYTSSGTNRTERIEEEHQAIFMAIARQDPDKARAMMRRHLENAIAHYQKVLLKIKD